MLNAFDPLLKAVGVAVDSQVDVIGRRGGRTPDFCSSSAGEIVCIGVLRMRAMRVGAGGTFFEGESRSSVAGGSGSFFFV